MFAKFCAITAWLVLFGVTPACAPDLTVARVDASTYEVFTSRVEGTAFAVTPTVAVTAGHVCVAALADNDHQVLVRLEQSADGAGLTVPAVILGAEESEGPGRDLCFLRLPVHVKPLPLTSEPAAGTPDTIVGYPEGVHAVTHGNYVAAGITTATGDHGASGAPVFTSAGVYGVVVSLVVDPAEPGPVAVTPSAEIRRAARALGVGL